MPRKEQGFLMDRGEQLLVRALTCAVLILGSPACQSDAISPSGHGVPGGRGGAGNTGGETGTEGGKGADPDSEGGGAGVDSGDGGMGGSAGGDDGIGGSVGGDDGMGGEGGADSPPDGGTVARLEVVPYGVLLTAVRDEHALSARAFDADGRLLDVPVEWSSSSTAVSVDGNGTVTANTGVGSAQISVSAGGLTTSATVTVAEPVSGAVLVTDDQISGEPVLEDSSIVPTIGARYSVSLTIDAPPLGSILIGSETKPVAGRVVATEPGIVVVEVVPLGEVFRAVDLSETFSLQPSDGIVPVATSAAFDVETRSTGRTIFSLKDPAEELGRGSVAALETVGPFTCEGTGSLGELELLHANLSLEPVRELELDVVWNDDLQRLVLRGEPRIQGDFEPRLRFQAAGRVECRLHLKDYRLRVPGWFGVFFGAVVPVGIGFSFEASLSGVELGARFDGSLEWDFAAGFHCSDGCEAENFIEPQAELLMQLTSVELDSRLEIGAQGFGWASLELGVLAIEQARLRALDAQAGLRWQADLATESYQASEPDYRSTYDVAAHAEAGPGSDFVSVTELLERAIDLPELEISEPLAESPTGRVSADRSSFEPEDDVTFRIELDPERIAFPVVGYNIDVVRLFRKDPFDDSWVLESELAAEPGQTVFTVPWTADMAGTSVGNFWVSVVTRALPSVGLEIGHATADECQFQALGMGFRDDYPVVLADLNQDGSVMVGNFRRDGDLRAFRWTAESGLVELPAPANGRSTYATATDRMGEIIVGSTMLTTQLANGGEHHEWVGLRWQNDAFTILRTEPPCPASCSCPWLERPGMQACGSSFVPLRISDDGSAVMDSIGVLRGGLYRLFPPAWDSATMEYRPGTNSIRAHDISADGSVVVGGCVSVCAWYMAPGLARGQADFAFRWVGDVVENISPASAARAEAWAVSADGEVVYGVSDYPTIDAVFRWTRATGAVPLGWTAQDVDCSADGATVVGNARSVPIWTADDGVRTVPQLYADQSHCLGPWSPESGSHMSGDGRVVIAAGTPGLAGAYEWFRVPLPSPAPVPADVFGVHPY